MTPVFRYGLIGAGMMGREHIDDIAHLDGAVVAAYADPDDGSRQAAAELLGERAVGFADHRELIESGLVDGVVVSTPNHTHADIVLDCLGGDLHVLVEKPLCTTVADCRRVIEAAADHRGVVRVGLEYRYMAPVARLVALAHGGVLGRLHMVAIREHRFPFLPKVGDWNRFNRNTGGTLVEKCCHFFDLMGLIAAAEPVRVYASGSQAVNHLDESYGGETPDVLDNAFVLVDHDNGVRSMLDLCMFAEASVNQEEVSVVGELGRAEAFLPSHELRLGLRRDGRHAVSTEVVRDPRAVYQGHHHGSSYLEHLEFLHSCRSGRAGGVGLREGLISVATGVAGQRSIEEGRAIELDEVL